MKNFSIAVIALKILSLYAFMRAMTDTNVYAILGPVIARQGKISVTELTVIFASALPMIFLFLCAMFLWTKAERIALIIVQRLPNEESNEVNNFYKIQVMAIWITGIIIIIGAIDQLPNMYQFFFFNPSAPRIPNTLLKRLSFQLIVIGIQTLIGLVLILRPHAVLFFLNRHDYDDTFHDLDRS